MKRLINVVEQFRLDSEEEVQRFIDEQKEAASQGGYTIKSYSSTFKEKKVKGETIDEGYLVRISKDYDLFWD